MTAKNEEMEALKRLAQSWNNLDQSFIEDQLADDCVYSSQWVLLPIEGRNSFIFYLQSKFQAIKSAMLNERMIIIAELAHQPAISNKPCIILTQITGEEIRQVSVLIKLKNRKVIRIDTCFIPDPTDAELTGEIPR